MLDNSSGLGALPGPPEALEEITGPILRAVSLADSLAIENGPFYSYFPSRKISPCSAPVKPVLSSPVSQF